MRLCSTTWLWWILSSLLFVAACKPVPEYRESESGYRWKLLSFKDNAAALDSAEHIFVEVLIRNATLDDTLFYEYDRLITSRDGRFFAFLTSMNVGDSLEVIVKQGDVLNNGLEIQDSLFYHLRIDRMRSEEDLEDARLQELMRLDDLIRSDTVSKAFSEYMGIYMQTTTQGDTLRVEKGREIVIHYRGRTAEGRIFDDSRRMDTPLRFVYGNEGQVLQGLEIALSRMHRGEVAEVILPSWMAFGSRGSADGRVAPYSTVYYTLEVIEVAP